MDFFHYPSCIFCIFGEVLELFPHDPEWTSSIIHRAFSPSTQVISGLENLHLLSSPSTKTYRVDWVLIFRAAHFSAGSFLSAMYARMVFVQGLSNPYSDCSRSFVAWKSTSPGSPSGDSIKFIMTGGPMLGCSMNSTGITLLSPDLN